MAIKRKTATKLIQTPVPVVEAPHEVQYTPIGGDLEARWDGGHYIDIRVMAPGHSHLLISRAALTAALALMPQPPKRLVPSKG